MFVPDARFFEFLFEFRLENLLEDILEAAVIGFENGVFGREIDGPAQIQAVIERGAGEVIDGFIQVEHRHGHARIGGIEDFFFDDCAVFAFIFQRDFACRGEGEIGCAILIAIGMAAHHNRFGPARHKAGDVLADDWLAEDHTAQNIANGAIGAAIHPFEAEFLDAGLIGGDRCAFDGDAHFFGLFGGINRDLVIGAIAFLDAEIIIEQINIEIGQDQLLLDEIPDNAGHLIAIHLDDGVCDLDFAHGGGPPA